MIHVHVRIDDFQTCADVDPHAYIVYEPALFESFLDKLIDRCLRQVSTDNAPDPHCCAR